MPAKPLLNAMSVCARGCLSTTSNFNMVYAETAPAICGRSRSRGSADMDDNSSEKMCMSFFTRFQTLRKSITIVHVLHYFKHPVSYNIRVCACVSTHELYLFLHCVFFNIRVFVCVERVKSCLHLRKGVT